jgi:LacI family transcriptional regulator
MKPAIPSKHILLLLKWYDYRIHHGVAEVAKEAGWHLICPKSTEDTRRLLQGWRGDGCISLIDWSKTVEGLSRQNIPAVDLGLARHDLADARVVTDNWEIGRLAAQHFLDRGFRELFVWAPRGVPMFRERMEAVSHFMQEGGGTIRVLSHHEDDWYSLHQQLREIAARRKQRLEELSVGFFAYEDYRAAELISVCLEHGLRVPENVAVLGVDNDSLINDGLAVGLSSIDSDQEGLGRAGANLLWKLLEQPSSVERGTILRHPPKGIVTRQSTDCYAVGNPLVTAALRWIHDNLTKLIQAKDVSKAMGVSQQGLQKAFSKNHIRSPGQEIRYQRVQAAAHALSHTRDSLEAVAMACGYSSVKALITNFRAFRGTTPGRFRRQKRGGRSKGDRHYPNAVFERN